MVLRRRARMGTNSPETRAQPIYIDPVVLHRLLLNFPDAFKDYKKIVLHCNTFHNSTMKLIFG